MDSTIYGVMYIDCHFDIDFLVCLILFTDVNFVSCFVKILSIKVITCVLFGIIIIIIIASHEDEMNDKYNDK